MDSGFMDSGFKESVFKDSELKESGFNCGSQQRGVQKTEDDAGFLVK